jgi:hypothetical protein
MREFIIILILVLSVFSSKQIFIFNEEIIVALSFVAFVLFTQQMFGNNIKALFDERQAGILTELQQYCDLKDTLLAESIKQYELRSINLKPSTQMVGDICISEIKTRCAPKCKQTVLSILSQQYDSKLKTLFSIQEQSRISIQRSIVTHFRNIIKNQFRLSKLRKLQSKLIKQSITLLSQSEK